MVANDDLEGKTTHFTGFYTHTISGPNIPKPPIVKYWDSNEEEIGTGSIQMNTLRVPISASSASFQFFCNFLRAFPLSILVSIHVLFYSSRM